MKKRLLIPLLLFGLQLTAQTPRFRHLNVNDGLTGNAVNAICQDKKGFIWIGGQTGLCRFDGLNIKTWRHKPNDTTSIISDDIVCLYADQDNFLWIGTRSGGLCKMNLTTSKVIRYKTDTQGKGRLNAYGVLCITEGKNNTLYIGTDYGGLNILDKKTNRFTYLLHNPNDTNSIASNNIRCFTIDKHGKWWMGHIGSGVSCYNPVTKKVKRFNDHHSHLDSRLNSNTVRSILCDSRNRIWISAWSGGINIYDQRYGKMYDNRIFNKENKLKNSPQFFERNKYPELSEAGMVYAFTEDRYGNIWMACIESGLMAYNIHTGKVRQFKNSTSNPFSICDNNVLSVYVDRSGLVWAGSLTSGISIYNPYTDKMGYYMANPGLPGEMQNSQVWSIHQSKHSQRIFVGILGHVYIFDPDHYRFTEYVVDGKGKTLLESQAIVQSLIEDAKGHLWISVNGAGIYVFNPSTKNLKNYHTDKPRGGLINSTVNFLYEDLSGNIWAGVPDGGLERYAPEGDSFIHHYYRPNQPGTLSAYAVLHMTEDKNGRLWIATDSGVNVLKDDKRSFIHYRPKNSGLSHEVVYSVFCDNQNNIWAGTKAGLCRFDTKTKKFTDISASMGWNSAVLGITQDQAGDLWLLNEKGIRIYSPKTGQSRQYEYADGLQSNEFPLNAIVTDNKGHLVTGGAKGLNCFIPAHLIENNNIPPVSLTRFLLRNQELNLQQDISFTPGITLNYDHYFFTIEFASLDFTNTSKNQYRYKLEGFNEDWVDLGNKQQVTFVNLDPGEYVFRVAASNNDGVWNMKGATLKIKVTPPFWKTKWFYTLCIVFVLTCIYLFIKFRERKLKKEKLVLEEKVTERTNELREEKEKVEEAHKEIKDSIYYAQRIQTAIIPTSEEFVDLLNDAFVMFRPKDVVSGDFYWITRLDNGDILYATADCTGHGVPGGFMSMLGTSFLNEIVNEKKITEPAVILDILREKVINALKQTGAAGENKDGMDITLVKIVKDGNKIVFAGANNPVWLVQQGNVLELKPDKQPVGFYLDQKAFTQQEVQVNKGDLIYSFTDGYADQFGGPKGKKFKYSSLQNLLLSVSHLPAAQQYQKLVEAFEDWKKNTEQTDDVCVIGIRI